MKTIYILPILTLIFSCSEQKNAPEINVETEKISEIIITEFQEIIDSAKVKGAILIYNLEDDKYYSNDFERSRRGNLPASTFKITNSIIALETGVVENDSSIFKWNGEERRLKNWEQDLTFRDALHFSCVPCYQDIARKIGDKKMNEYLTKLDYGNMDVDSSNIDLFWLEGASSINQFEQIDFLKRFYNAELPISKRSEMIMKRMMVIEENEAFKLSGKTGWSIRNGNDNGWFVGYIESRTKTFFFATNVEPKAACVINMFSMIRKEITYDALRQMGIIN